MFSSIIRVACRRVRDASPISKGVAVLKLQVKIIGITSGGSLAEGECVDLVPEGKSCPIFSPLMGASHSPLFQCYHLRLQ